MKPFESHNKQLKILRRRGMEVPSSAKRDLENENYYNIINGYKDLFLELDVNGNFWFLINISKVLILKKSFLYTN